MVRCPNCGQKASGDYCECCKYPILRASSAKRREAQRRAEEARKAREADKQAKKEAELAAKEKAKREAEEARKAREADKQAKKEAELAAKEKAKREAEEAVRDTDSGIYEGNFRLVLPLPVGFEQVRQFKERLEQIENLRIVWTGGSVAEGAIIAVSVQKPMTLIRILNEMPMVEKVDKKGEKIVAVLKTPTVS